MPEVDVLDTGAFINRNLQNQNLINFNTNDFDKIGELEAKNISDVTIFDKLESKMPPSQQ